MNEDWDEQCARCDVARIKEPDATPPETAAGEDTIATPAVVPPKQDDTVIPPAKTTVEQEKSKSTNVSLLLVIAISLVGLMIVASLAWQRGLIDPAMFAKQQTTPGTADQPVETSMWDEAPQCPKKYRRAFSAYQKSIESAVQELSGMVISHDGKGVLSEESYTALNRIEELGVSLTWEYQQFEDKVIASNDPSLGEYGQFMRDRFGDALEALVSKLGEVYSLDLGDTHAAYLLSDNIPVVLEQYSLLGTENIKTTWAAAARAKHQLELDQQYGEQYRQLSARVAALQDVHRLFNEQLSAIPPYTVRFGRLGKDARDLIELVDALATKVEVLTVEFEEYYGSLSELKESDAMAGYQAQFLSLAKTDHKYCFEECYRIYAKDKELVNAVYDNLAIHFEFVKEHWPRSAVDYQEIYYTYETKWANSWLEE